MSKEIEQDTKERRERIAQWQKEGADFSKGRKARNQALIHLGLATLDLIANHKLDKELVLESVIVNKQKLVANVIEAEVARKLF